MHHPELTPDQSAERGPRRDLRGHPLPPNRDWTRPEDRLDELFRRAEAQAIGTVEWYLRAGSPRRLAAKSLRGAIALLTATGAALPVLQLTGLLPGAAAWGYGAFVLAGGCVAADRWLGVTTGWMRHRATAQALQRRLEAFQYEWVGEQARDALGPAETSPADGAERCLAVLRRFSADTAELVHDETAAWMLEFHAPSSSVPAVRGGPRDDAGCGAPGGFPGYGHDGAPHRRNGTPPPGFRPNMPRQRPPEPPA